MTYFLAGDTGRMRKALAAVLLLGMVIRVPSIAVGWHTSRDIETYIRWGETIERQGLERAYEGTDISYPPVLLYLFSGAVLVGGMESRTATLLIQVVAALGDLSIAGLLAWVVWRRSAGVGVLAAGAYVFNPAVWYTSAVWGQTDSVYTLLLLGCVIALERRGVLAGWVLYVLALGTKLQAIALAPLVAGSALARQRVGEIIGALLGASVVGLLVGAPWLLAGRGSDLLRVYTTPPEARTVVSAYNFWCLALGGNLRVSSEARPGDFFLTYGQIGSGLFALLALPVVGLAVWRKEGLALPAAALTLSLFLVMTQMHERHAYPTLAFLVWGAADRMAKRGSDGRDGEGADYRGIWWVYGLLTVTMLFNMITILPFSDVVGPSLLVEEADSTRGVILKGVSLLVAVVNVGLLVRLIWYVWEEGRRRAD